jgi:hypothetical protein
MSQFLKAISVSFAAPVHVHLKFQRIQPSAKDKFKDNMYHMKIKNNLFIQRIFIFSCILVVN